MFICDTLLVQGVLPIDGIPPELYGLIVTHFSRECGDYFFDFNANPRVNPRPKEATHKLIISIKLSIVSISSPPSAENPQEE